MLSATITIEASTLDALSRKARDRRDTLTAAICHRAMGRDLQAFDSRHFTDRPIPSSFFERIESMSQPELVAAILRIMAMHEAREELDEYHAEIVEDLNPDTPDAERRSIGARGNAISECSYRIWRRMAYPDAKERAEYVAMLET